jgi:ethanolamine utilization protein EutN
MNVARVIGTIWATRKYEGLEGAKVQMIQPLSCDLDPIGRPLAAVDTVGAGEGELVYYVTAYEAVIPFFRPNVPIDASLVGIIDSIDHDRGALEALRTAKLPRRGGGA